MKLFNRCIPVVLHAALAGSILVSAQIRPAISRFDAPGAGNEAGQGTIPIVVSATGVVMGQFVDAQNVYHGFLRSRQGTFTVIDAPGSGKNAGQGTVPSSMNEVGEITGDYVDASGSSHGFIRYPQGKIVTFDAPGAGSGGCTAPIICANGTQGASINSEGLISGQYVDAKGVFHGFVRSPFGTIHTVDAPGAGMNPGQGTFLTLGDGINPEGAVAGGYADAGGNIHALVRKSDGTFAEFDPPGSVFTNNSGITPDGTVTSYYVDAGSVLHGYIRAADGNFTLFDVPGAGADSNQGTEPLNINARKDITGAYIDTNGVNHGFLRYASGVIAEFDVPEAGRASGQGTTALFNNANDAICGFFVDGNGISHGFVRAAPDGDR